MGPLGNLVDLLEANGAVVVRESFDTHRINAISVWHPGLGPVFAVNRDLPPDRQRFVLAHELGHMVMHEGEPPRDTAELEADSFAEEFLMPASEILSDLRDLDLARAAALKPYWRVPMQSLILRAEHLSVITSGRSRSLHALMNRKRYLPVEPLQFEREEPSIVNQMMTVHLVDHEYSLSDFSRILGLPEERLPLEVRSPQSRNGLRLMTN